MDYLQQFAQWVSKDEAELTYRIPQPYGELFVMARGRPLTYAS